jgi:mannosyltransferase OCH1-like enzyme
MRRRSRRFLLLVTFVLAFLIYRSQPLLKLLSEVGALDTISASQLFTEAQKYSNPDLIPKIIHQTYKNTSIPLKWQQMQNMILKYHDDYEYMVCQHPFLTKPS